MENISYTKWADILKTIGRRTAGDGCRNTFSLRDKGIVHHERCGSRVRYSVTDRKIEEIINLIKSR